MSDSFRERHMYRWDMFQTMHKDEPIMIDLCPDSYGLGKPCEKEATVPLWFKYSKRGPILYCPEHAASNLRRLPSAFTDTEPSRA